MTDLERIAHLTKTLIARDREIADQANTIQYLETAQERLLLRAEAAEAAKAELLKALGSMATVADMHGAEGLWFFDARNESLALIAKYSGAA